MKNKETKTYKCPSCDKDFKMEDFTPIGVCYECAYDDKVAREGQGSF